MTSIHKWMHITCALCKHNSMQSSDDLLRTQVTSSQRFHVCSSESLEEEIKFGDHKPVMLPQACMHTCGLKEHAHQFSHQLHPLLLLLR